MTLAQSDPESIPKRESDALPVDIAILGGGPIGLACALMLARQGLSCELIEARAAGEARRDQRLLALSRGSLQTLMPLLAGAPPPSAEILEVDVSSAGEFGGTRLSAADFGGVALGATVLYADLVESLGHAAQREPLIRVRQPRCASALSQRPEAVDIALDDGTRLAARLAINAGGAPATSTPSSAASQVALLAQLELPRVRNGLAFERFTREGPLALLPLPPAGPVAPTPRLSMIWCVGAAAAQRRSRLDDRAFLDEVCAAFGPRIARPVAVRERAAFALQPHVRERIRENRLVHVGNAAQTVHPVAGQGFNLGLRDCACLARVIAGAEGDPIRVIDRYAAMRKADRAFVSTLTEWLPRGFSARFGPLAAARSAALVALDIVPPLRRAFAGLLMFGVRI